MTLAMPRKSRLELPPLELGEETIGQRIAGLRKERGYTQQELAEHIGLIQSLVSDYERGKLRLNAEMLARFAIALEVSADEILGLKDRPQKTGAPKSRRLKRRLRALEDLPRRDQEALLRTIDAFLAKAS
jgi:transcriptional regulator with XRE-family HTH domain